MMGNLPAVRVTPAPAFFHTGVDYAGPFIIHYKAGRGYKLIKAYICLFVCMSTKAIHFELTTELSKESFLTAFRRFISRRGKPKKMYSDNGKNFVAAEKELTALHSFLNQKFYTISEILENEGFSWKFIPVYAPHFGGIWEAGVKQNKVHLKKMMNNINLTFEQFYTILCQIEAILNSRP